MKYWIKKYKKPKSIFKVEKMNNNKKLMYFFKIEIKIIKYKFE
jgi:hypothetical protein